jgi:dTDP-4-amino-4,6-dideoxygalactose transaminase
MIPYGRQSIDKKDIEAVVEVLRSDWLTNGPKVPEFETALAKFVGAKYAVAVCNGTAALHAAMYGLHPRHYDEVIGMCARQDIKCGTPLSWNLLKSNNE